MIKRRLIEDPTQTVDEIYQWLNEQGVTPLSKVSVELIVSEFLQGWRMLEEAGLTTTKIFESDD